MATSAHWPFRVHCTAVNRTEKQTGWEKQTSWAEPRRPWLNSRQPNLPYDLRHPGLWHCTQTQGKKLKVTWTLGPSIQSDLFAFSNECNWSDCTNVALLINKESIVLHFKGWLILCHTSKSSFIGTYQFVVHRLPCSVVVYYWLGQVSVSIFQQPFGLIRLAVICCNAQ